MRLTKTKIEDMRRNMNEMFDAIVPDRSCHTCEKQSPPIVGSNSNPYEYKCMFYNSIIPADHLDKGCDKYLEDLEIPF